MLTYGSIVWWPRLNLVCAKRQTRWLGCHECTSSASELLLELVPLEFQVKSYTLKRRRMLSDLTKWPAYCLSKTPCMIGSSQLYKIYLKSRQIYFKVLSREIAEQSFLFSGNLLVFFLYEFLIYTTHFDLIRSWVGMFLCKFSGFLKNSYVKMSSVSSDFLIPVIQFERFKKS